MIRIEKTHHKNTGEKKPKQKSFWKYVSVVLGILLLISVLTDGFKLQGAFSKITQAAQKLTAGINAPSAPSTGTNTNAKVIIEEYSDFQCPFCGRAYPTVKKIEVDYGKDVKIVFKHFPLSFHPFAQKASEASECARDQGKFDAMHDKMFENQQALTIENLKQYAKDIGMETGRFNACLDSGEKASIVDKDFKEGQAKGVSGTPTFFINGQRLVGAQPYENFKPVIDAALSGKPVEQAPSKPQAQQQAQNIKVSIDDDAIKGKSSAKVIIIEFSDFQCPFCSRFYTQTLPSIASEYIDSGKVRFVYRDFPLSFHPNAQPAAEASECAKEQGRYWEYHDKLFANNDKLSPENYKAWAKELGLDMAKFNSCVDTRKYQQEVQKDFADGQAVGVTGTPAFFIGVIQPDGKTIIGDKLVGAQPFASFKTVIDSQLAKI